MRPSDIYTLTLSQLRDIELTMTSPEGDALIQRASPKEHKAVITTLLDVHTARLALGNAALQSIADQLTANESAITAGTAAVKATLSRLDDLAQILNTVTTLINVVAQIVPMV